MSCGGGCGGGSDSPPVRRIPGQPYRTPPPRAAPVRSPARSPPPRNQRGQLNQTFITSPRTAYDGALPRPRTMRNAPVRPDRAISPPRNQRRPMDQTFITSPGTAYDGALPRPRPLRNAPIHLAESIMDDIGDGSVWNESSAVSLSDYQSENESEGCPPCDDLDDITPPSHLYDGSGRDRSGSPFQNISRESEPSHASMNMSRSHRQNISAESDPFSRSGNSTRSRYQNISAESAPYNRSGNMTLSRYQNISAESDPNYETSHSQECTPCYGMGDESTPSFANFTGESGASQQHNISDLAAGPSNLSVYDAEELNITTAPRDESLDVPRHRIWNTLTESLDETELDEENNYMDFVAGLQNRRRQFFQGAIFTEDQRNSSVELAFRYAVYKINKERDILPNTTLAYDIQYVPRDDSFRTSKKACKQMEFGVQAIFGPSDPILGAHIQSICEALDVPHLEARIDFEPQSKQLSINLHPSQENMNKAFKDLMRFLNWTKVAIIYEEDYGLFKLQDLVKAPGVARTEMYIRQASPSSYRQVLREVRQKEIYKLIVDTNPNNIQQFFRAILQLQMNDYRYHYMFTTFDIETFDLEDFKYNSVNITAFRLIDVEHPKVRDILAAMEKFQPTGHSILNRSGIIQAEPALMYDSVYVFAKGLAAMDSGHTIKPTNLSCEIEKPWDDGLSLYNYLDSVSNLHGLTGNLEFQEGKRTNFKVDLLKLKKEEIQKVGTWTPSDGINITDPNAFYDQNAPNITLIVMTREERPYVMVKEDQNLTGNARYEGFCIDLLKWIAGQVGFQYSIRLVPDHMYGVFDPETKQWNGIVRELMEKRADLAVASMTINYARESVIDFTKPFMNLGIGILFKIPTSQPTRLFSFMNPLAVEIWIYVLAAYLLVSFTLFVMARFSPYEWNNPHPCHQDSDIVENQFSVSNSFWFITGTFLRQGSGLNPKVYKRAPARLFSFLTPLAIDIWIYMVLAYVLVSLTIWIAARFSPREWREIELCDDCLLKKYNEIYPEGTCQHTFILTADSDGSSGIGSERAYEDEDEDQDDIALNTKAQETETFLHEHNSLCEEITTLDVLENGFTIGNSFWFAIGSLMQQGSDLNPKATSTRIVGGIWWFFTLIIISSYTANLAAFLTVERMITPIESATDLADQTEISYGTLEGGSTMTFFRDSKIGIYQKMWRFMESKKPPVFVKSYEEGITRVLQGNYAFLMESTMLDYAVQRDCNLTQIGGLLDSKGYGIATPKGSQWRDKISLAILELQEKGVIQILYDKWWKNTGDVCTRDDKSKESKANALGVENIGGVFVVLLCGLALAILVAILEFCWNSKKNAQTDRQSLCSEMAEELRFAMRCHGSRQRPALRRSCARCSPATTYVPAALDLPHLNGEGVILPMMDIKKSPITYDVDT